MCIRVQRVLLLVLLVGMLGIHALAQSSAGCNLNSANAYADRARAAANRGDYEAAVQDLSCGLELDPRNLDILNSRGNAYYNLDRLEDALGDYNAVLEINPDYHYTYNNRANIYYMRGDYQTALEGYTRAIELDPEPEIPYYNRALAHYELGDYAQAAADLDESLAVDPEYAPGYLLRADLTLVQGGAAADAAAAYLRWTDLYMSDIQRSTLEEALAQGLEIVQRRAYRLSFTAEAGQMLSIAASAVSGSSADPLLVLLGPDGAPLVGDDDSGVNLNAIIRDFTLPVGGTYTLVLSHAGGEGEGALELTVSLGDVVTASAEAASFATYRLFVNEIAEVYTTGGDRLNLRSGPGLNFEILEKLERGTLVRLLEGPRKFDGYAWWRVRDDNGNTGWAVERVEEEQTLQLALLTEQIAIVATGEEKLNLRAEPATNAQRVTQLEDGTRVTLLEAPVIEGGFRWWHLRTDDGVEGWAVDRVQGERTLVPARERE